MRSERDEPAWFESAVLELLPDLVATARHLTRNPADAEDLVADAVAKAWLGLGSLRDRGRFRGWMFRILTNRFVSDRRARRNAQEESLDELEAEFSLFERLHQPFLLWWGTPEQAFLDRVLRADLERAIAALPDVFRLVVILADVQGFSYAEISETLGIPGGTVRSRLARGRALLQRALWQHGLDAGLASPTQPRKPAES